MNAVKIVVIGSGSNAEKFVKDNSENDFIEIIGTIPDEKLDKNSDYRVLLEKCDVVFALGYSYIISEEVCDKYFIINLHAGILPKWRGFSANAWAVMNGVDEIGYSLHRVTSTLDGGQLYFVKHIPIKKSETISDVYYLMIDSIINECPELLYKIFNNELKGIKQNMLDVAYCTRFNKNMGRIKFDKDAEYYVNLHRCMAKPLGSGVYFIYKGEEYLVNKVENGKTYGIGNYLCEVGKIVNIKNESLYVKVNDGVIVLSKIEKEGVMVNVEVFRNGQCIGGQ